MKHITIEDLIQQLQQQVADGLPSTTPVAVREVGAHGFVSFEMSPVKVGVAKSDFDKGWNVCRLVSRGGIPVLVIG